MDFRCTIATPLAVNLTNFFANFFAAPWDENWPWLTTLVLGQTGLFSKPLIAQKWYLYLQMHHLMGQLLTLSDHPLPLTSKEILAILCGEYYIVISDTVKT